MKVLMQGRFGLLQAFGGDRIQVENTASELRKLGVEVDISTELKIDRKSYDIIHIFQLDWTSETHLMVKLAKKAGKPVVFSPIHHNVEEVKKFDDDYVFDFRRLSKILFRDQHTRDTFKNVYRSFLQRKMIYPTLYAVIYGLKNMHQKTLTMSDAVLVQTELEAKDLINTYDVDFSWFKVPNGVGEQFFNIGDLKNPLNITDYIFSVGRVEPRKNQLYIIEAMKRLREETKQDLQLVFVGTKNKRNHMEYTSLFNKCLEKYSWIKYIPQIPYEEIPAYFKYAKVCVSASWFETTGLTLLDSLYCGTNAVASSPRAKEILGKNASYCEPDNINSIKDAIKKEYFAPRPEIDDEMKKEYTWQNAAKKTYEVYKQVLEEN